MRYADAGVNIAVADEAKSRIRHLATRTFTNGVMGGIGSFGALFALDMQLPGIADRRTEPGVSKCRAKAVPLRMNV